MKTKKIYWWFHILGSLLYLSFPIIFSPELSSNFEFIHFKGFQRDFFTHILLLGLFYLSYFLLIPRFYFQKKYIKFLLILIISFGLIVLTREIFFHHPKEDHHFSNNKNFQLQKKQEHIHPHHRQPPGILFFIFGGRDFLNFSLAVILPLMIKTSAKWKQAEQEKINTELSFLKAQINPHFLFNSLNSIFSMSISENAERSADAVQKLSEMMRYVLEESEHEFVSLEKEINYIKNYIELQKLRFGDTIDIIYDVNADFKNKKIAPLIIIPFVENAFKFGVSPEKKSILLVNLSTVNNSLRLHVKNEKLRRNFPESERHGIGIKNTKTRLNLLYPDRHKLEINETESDFEIKLNLNMI
ncbi:MAG: sensor histidine kinase [Bacteroidota bacterium]|jgi:hypothetical protein